MKLKYPNIKTSITGLILTAFIAVNLSSCESTFDPYPADDRLLYSVFGALDFSADTQWVRVMPLRDSLFYNPKSVDAEVRLTRESTGDSFTMNDSLFSYFHYFDTDNTVYAPNFWGEYSLQEGESYTLSVNKNSELASSVTVDIPRDFPTPVVEDFNENDWTGIIWIPREVERLVVADIIYYYRPFSSGNPGPPTISRVSQIEREKIQPASGGYRINVDDQGYLASLFSPASVNIRMDSAKVLIVSAGESWPEYDPEEEGFQFQESNVENGLGLLVGIVSKKFPYQSCVDENEDPVACPLEKNSYNGPSVSLEKLMRSQHSANK